MSRRAWLTLLVVTLVIAATPSALAESPACSLQQGLNGGTAPRVSQVTTSAITQTSATLTVSISPGDAPTNYVLEYRADPDGPLIRVKSGSLDGCDGSDTVSATLTGLTPGTDYIEDLVATNQYGKDEGAGSFGTPVKPAPPPDVNEHPLILVSTHSTDVTLGTPIEVRVRLLGHFQTGAQNYDAPKVRLSYSLPPFHTWHASAVTLPVASGRLTMRLPAQPDGYDSPSENMRVRAQLGTSTSNTLTIYVEPAIEYNVARANGGFSPDVVVYYSAETDVPQYGVYPRPEIYLYRGASARGPFTRIAARRLIRRGVGLHGTILAARFVVRDPGRHEYVTCSPRPIVRNMGRPFTDRACGRRRIR